MGITDIDSADKNIKLGSKLNLIGGIVNSVGALADTVNTIYQASKGRIPIPIGQPFQAIGGTLNAYGNQRGELGQRQKAVQSIRSVPNLDDTQKTLIEGAINSGEPAAGFKGAFDVLAAQEMQPYKDLQSNLSLQRFNLDASAEQRRVDAEDRKKKMAGLKYQALINSIDTIKKGLDDLEVSSNKLAPGRLGGTYEKVKGLVGNKQLKEFETKKQSLIMNVARTLGGEKGPLSDTDIAIWKDTLSRIYDTPEEKAAAFKALKDLADQRINEYQQSIDYIDSNGSVSGNMPSIPNGAKGKVMGSDGKLHWTDGKNDLGVAE